MGRVTICLDQKEHRVSQKAGPGGLNLTRKAGASSKKIPPYTYPPYLPTLHTQQPVQYNTIIQQVGPRALYIPI